MNESVRCPECGSAVPAASDQQQWRCAGCGYRWGIDQDAAPSIDPDTIQKTWQLQLQGRLAAKLRRRRYGCMAVAMLWITEAVIDRRDLTAAAFYASLGIGWLASGYVAVAWPHARFLLVDALMMFSFGICLLVAILLEPSSASAWHWVFLGLLVVGAIGLLRAYRRLADVEGTKTGLTLALIWLLLVAAFIPAGWIVSTRASRHEKRGNAHFDKEEFHEAISEYDKVLIVHPNVSAVLYNRALARRNLGDLAGAIADFSEAIALDPKNSRAWLQRGHCLLKLGQKTEAARDFQIRLNQHRTAAESRVRRRNRVNAQRQQQEALILAAVKRVWFARVVEVGLD